MRTIILATTALVAIGAVAFAAATGAPEGGDGHHGMGMHGMGMHGGMAMHHMMLGHLIAGYDTNGDGSITRAEIDSGLKKDFTTTDSNHDGKVSSTELGVFIKSQHAAMAEKMGHGGDGHDDAKGGAHGDGHGGMAPDPEKIAGMLIKHLDWNLDGAASLEEFSAPVRLAAMRLDGDSNGTISATDLLKGHGSMGGPH